MAHRAVLTARQRAALFDLPTGEALLLRHYTLSDEDIDFVRNRRRPENQIGIALQLCAFRYPGRLLRRKNGRAKYEENHGRSDRYLDSRGGFGTFMPTNPSF